MDPFSLPATCRISTHARHRVATVAIREHALIWVHRGKKRLMSSGVERVFRAGEAMVLYQGTQWDVINDPLPDARYEATVLQFGDSALAAFAAQVPAGPAPAAGGSVGLAMDDELADAVRRTVSILARADASPHLRLHRTVEVLLLLSERGCRLEPRAELAWPDRLRRLVAQQPHVNWSVDMLAKAFHMSASTFRRRMASVGCRVGDVVRETRLETGLALLQTTSMAVGEIALRCGYESHSRFTAAFRARFGFAPSDLRAPPGETALRGRAQELTPAG